MTMNRNRLYVFGGPRDQVSIGPNCLGIEIDDELNLFDCGVGMTSANRRDGQPGSYGPDLSLIKNMGKKVANVAFTHFHTDHTAYAPALEGLRLTKEDTIFWGTPANNAICKEMWMDRLNRATENDAIEYDYLNYCNSIDRFKTIEKPGQFQMGKLIVHAIPNGHTYSSTSFIIEMPSGRKALVLGDAAWHNQALVKGAFWPSTWPKEILPDEIWSNDMTYASGSSEDEKPYSQKRDELVAYIREKLAEDKTIVLIAASTGKGQSLAIDLAKAGVECWIDGSIRSFYEIMRQNRWSDLDELLPPLGNVSRIREIQSRRHRHEMMADGLPKVIITTSMMGDFGPIIEYLEYGLPKQNYVFIPTSWLAPGTNALRLLELVQKYPTWKGNEENRKTTLKVRNENNKDKKIVVSVTAEIKKFGMSSHGTFGDTLYFMKDLIGAKGKALDRIFVSHGTYEAISRGAMVFSASGFARSIIPAMRGTVVEID